MKDIDFDELDRAVSSLMSSVPKNKPIKEDAETTLVIPESAIDDDAKEPEDAVEDGMDVSPQAIETEPVIVSKIESAPLSESEVEPEPEETLAHAASVQPAPSRGRFMDMVRPSGDMRRTPSFVSRQGVALQPSLRPTVPTQQSRTEVDLAAQAAVLQELEDTASLAASDESDLDMHSPLSSPFLLDAKVEKRPLGRPTEATSPVDSSSEEFSEDDNQPAFEASTQVEEPSISPNKDAQRPEEPLPAELDSKLLSIETGADVPHLETPLSQSDASEEVISPAPLVTESVPSAMDAPRTLAAASIPQQYKLETSHNEEVPAGAIYDTQPIAHPATSKPGWLWILAIVAILILGAAGGAAVYYLGLI